MHYSTDTSTSLPVARQTADSSTSVRVDEIAGWADDKLGDYAREVDVHRAWNDGPDATAYQRAQALTADRWSA